MHIICTLSVMNYSKNEDLLVPQFALDALVHSSSVNALFQSKACEVEWVYRNNGIFSTFTQLERQKFRIVCSFRRNIFLFENI